MFCAKNCLGLYIPQPLEPSLGEWEPCRSVYFCSLLIVAGVCNSKAEGHVFYPCLWTWKSYVSIVHSLASTWVAIHLMKVRNSGMAIHQVLPYIIVPSISWFTTPGFKMYKNFGRRINDCVVKLQCSYWNL